MGQRKRQHSQTQGIERLEGEYLQNDHVNWDIEGGNQKRPNMQIIIQHSQGIERDFPTEAIV